MTTLKQNLVKARALIASLEHWTQFNHAITNDGIPISPLDKTACAWCADGALLKVAKADPEKCPGVPLWDAMSAALDAAAARTFAFNEGLNASYVGINDGEAFEDGNDVSPEECHAAIMRVFDEAIAHA